MLAGWILPYADYIALRVHNIHEVLKLRPAVM